MMPTNPHDLMDCAGNLIDGGPPPPVLSIYSSARTELD